MTYEADTLIYQYDCDYGQKKCFGYAGKDMDLNYRYIKTPKESGKYWRNERQTKGYYNWLEYVDETGLLFRSYQKGGAQPVDGLQIYKDGVLIGDVNVPKGLKSVGMFLLIIIHTSCQTKNGKSCTYIVLSYEQEICSWVA